MSDLCPCGSGTLFATCCQPRITGTKPAEAPEALMRSRYSAYVTGNADYLIASWHPDCHAENFRASLLEGFANTEWLGLHVISHQDGKQANEGFVEFAARFREPGLSKIVLIHERSRFIRINEHWYYIDGFTPETGRNDPCPCGADKKYKKCCGR